MFFFLFGSPFSELGTSNSCTFCFYLSVRRTYSKLKNKNTILRITQSNGIDMIDERGRNRSSRFPNIQKQNRFLKLIEWISFAWFFHGMHFVHIRRIKLPGLNRIIKKFGFRFCSLCFFFLLFTVQTLIIAQFQVMPFEKY